jgi:hypothetical protein
MTIRQARDNQSLRVGVPDWSPQFQCPRVSGFIAGKLPAKAFFPAVSLRPRFTDLRTAPIEMPKLREDYQWPQKLGPRTVIGTELPKWTWLSISRPQRRSLL